MHSSQNVGGLGLRRLDLYNQVLLEKWLYHAYCEIKQFMELYSEHQI